MPTHDEWIDARIEAREYQRLTPPVRTTAECDGLAAGQWDGQQESADRVAEMRAS